MLTRGFHDALEDDNYLKLLVHEGALRQIEERALGVDLVADGERRHQEELVGPRSKTHIQLTLVQGQELALWGLTRLEAGITRAHVKWPSSSYSLPVFHRVKSGHKVRKQMR